VLCVGAGVLVGLYLGGDGAEEIEDCFHDGCKRRKYDSGERDC
jgi:hypothetical protein